MTTFKNLLLLIVLITLCSSNLNAQSLSPEIISNAGGNFENQAVGTLSWTIGEVVTESFEGSDITLTQGFQQSELKLSSIKEELPFTIKVFPNPTSDLLFIEGEFDKEYLVRLLSVNGKVLKANHISDSNTSIKIIDLPSSNYFLQIVDESTLNNNIYKIIKQ